MLAANTFKAKAAGLITSGAGPSMPMTATYPVPPAWPTDAYSSATMANAIGSRMSVKVALAPLGEDCACAVSRGADTLGNPAFE